MRLFSRKTVVPVLRFSGPIGIVTPLRPGLSMATTAEAINQAFKVSKTPAVAVIVNSPGGSPLQSSLIFRRIRQLSNETGKTVYVFCEDVAASGGYYLAASGDEIYADTSSIIGSIGVISAGFGFTEAIKKLGIDRRVYASGDTKNQLDPFLPENAEDIKRLRAVQRDVHDAFIGIIKERRGAKLSGPDQELFSGAFWSAPKAMELGLIDGISDVRTKMREIFGDKVRLKLISKGRGGIAGLLRRQPSVWHAAQGDMANPADFADGLIAAIETRMLWSRFGL